MQHFSHDGFDIAYMDRGDGEPILLIHGFASNLRVNWDGPSWFSTLNDAGYRVIALDNRGHGNSSKSHNNADYTPTKMASDAAALLGHLGITTAHVMGYSMGARIGAFLAIEHPDCAKSLVLGGLGIGLVEGVGDWDPIADALLAEDAGSIMHERGLMFRKFADQTKSDRLALAACIQTSRTLVTRQQAAQITQPTLVAVGTNDDIAGDPFELARLMPNARGFAIEGRDHMLAVGDRTFKAAVLEFLALHDR
jgi:pimeloyl-ACP methyl ester carboxylesterase